MKLFINAKSVKNYIEKNIVTTHNYFSIKKVLFFYVVQEEVIPDFM